MRTRSLFFGLVFLTACSQKFASPLATSCNDGIAVSSGSAWQCKPAAQLAVGWVAAADHAQNAAQATQALEADSAGSADNADGFTPDAQLGFASQPLRPGIPIETDGAGIELENHSVVTGFQHSSDIPSYDVIPGGVRSESIVSIPTGISGHLRIRVSGQLVALTAATTCRMILLTGPSGTTLATTEVSSAGELRSWYLEAELDLPTTENVIALEMLNQGDPAQNSECVENPATNPNTTPVALHVEVMNHGE